MNKFILRIAGIVVVVSLIMLSFSLRRHESKNDILNMVMNCQRELLNSGEDFILCCEKNKNIYPCVEKTEFHPGELVIFYSKIRRINHYFSPYYLCFKTDLERIKLPIDNPNLNIVSEDNYECSVRLDNVTDVDLAVAGRFPLRRGDLTVIEVRLYPDYSYNYTSKADFINYENSSVLAIKYVVSVT